MGDKCSFCNTDAENEPETLFVKHGKAVICEPCVDNCKKEMVDFRASGKLLPIAAADRSGVRDK